MGFDSLNPQQQQAVQYLDSPLLIVAGPGTGKTKVLTEKVIFLANKGYDPAKILVTTFTIKAAEEIKERIRKSLGDNAENIQISTIHSFCQKMLQSFPEYFKSGILFEVLDDLDQFIYINKNYWNYGLKDFIKEIDLSDLINFYNKCTENNIDPKILYKKLKENDASKLDLAICKSYELYLDDLLNSDNIKLDFALLQREFLHLIENNKEILINIRNMFDYIIIDEYQDTNPIQDRIFRLIAEPKFNITVVGDEDQSIYGFRGASIKNFRTFLERYPRAKKLELEENYRSCPEIVNTFDKFMSPNRVFVKKIFTKNSSFSKPIIIKSSSNEEEAINLVNLIQQLVANNKINYGDIAILLKSVKFHSEYIIKRLYENKIPYISIGDSSLLTKNEIKEILLLMLYINSHEPDDYQKEHYFQIDILYSDFLDLSIDTIEKMKGIIDKYHFIDSYDNIKLNKLKIIQKDYDILIALLNLKKEQTRVQINQFNLFYKILDHLGYFYRLFFKFLHEKDSNSEIKIKNLAKFSLIIQKFEKNTNSTKFSSFVYHLGKIPENKIDDSASFDDINAVKLMTIHQAKGLEFPFVILAGINQRRYNRNNYEDKEIIEIPVELMIDKYKYDRGEELQRTFYVGMSRAQKILTISSIEGHKIKASPFIDEIGEEMMISMDKFDKNFTEKDHYIPQLEKIKLSYSSINAYITCPFRFYCIEILEFHTPVDYYQVYGVIVHSCLQKIHTSIKEKKKLRASDIVSIVDLYCKDEDSRKKWRNELITDLSNYYRKSFDYIQEVLEVEYPFSLLDQNIMINGKVDLVIKNKNNDIEIIDFKSRFWQGLSKMNVDIQLRIYNIALKGKYSKESIIISAYTFKDNKLTRFSNTSMDLEETKKLISQIKNSIDQKQFQRNWQGDFCKTKAGKCEFYSICKKLEEDKE